MDDGTPRVAVIGAGIAGAACAAALRSAGVRVDHRERGRAPGGRLAAPTVHGRRVDLGAAYFTVTNTSFRAVAKDWKSRDLARKWTKDFDVVSPEGIAGKPGPVRWAAPDGLRSLVRDLLPSEDAPRFGEAVDSLGDLDHDAVVLAMPDPQAERLAGDAFDWVAYEPVIAVAAGWTHRGWPVADAAFVNDDPHLSFVADDGSRRGDGAPVLVAHTTADLAREHLDRPEDAAAPVLAALDRLLGVRAAPQWVHTHRWTFAKPVGTHGDAAYGLLERDGRPLGVCGDSWCPDGSPRVESAWLSGRRLGTELGRRLTRG